MLSHCESPYFHVTLGYVGPTDACLVLNFRGKQKEYLIESDAWKVLCRFWDIPSQTSPYIPKDSPNGQLLWDVWQHRDEDLREEKVC